MFPEFMLYNLEMESDERVVDIKVSRERIWGDLAVLFVVHGLFDSKMATWLR